MNRLAGKITNILTIIGYLIFSIISYSYINGNFVLASTMISLCYIWLFIILGVVCCSYVNKMTDYKIVVAIIILAIVNVFLNSLTEHVDNLFNYSKKVLMFSGSLIWILYCKYAKIDSKTYKIIFMLSSFVGIYALISFQSGFAFEENGFFLKYFFPNTNQTGMFIAIIISTIFSGVFFMKKKIERIVIIILVFCLLYLLYWTGCRSAMLSVAFILLMLLMDCLFSRNFIFDKRIIFLFSIFPLLFLIFYLTYVSVVDIDLSFGFADAGKSNNTRILAWQENLRYVYDSFLIGDYYGVSGGTGESQSLNTHLEVLVSFGLIPLILFISFLYRTLSIKVYKIHQRYGMYAFMSCFIIGTFEAGLVAGSSGLFIAAFGSLLLINIE